MRRVSDGNAPDDQGREVGFGQFGSLDVVGQVRRQLAEQLYLVETPGAGRDYGDARVTHLPPIAVRTVGDAVAPPLGEAGNGWQFVAESPSDEKSACGACSAVVEGDDEIADTSCDLHRPSRFDHSAVLGKLVAAGGDQV